MKTGKYHIFYSWLLLLCFVAGQYMVYAHQHPGGGQAVKISAVAKAAPNQSVKEKCDLCDLMLHNAMIASHQVYFNPVCVIGHVFTSREYNFTSIQLILSGGRAPPAAIS